MKNPKWAFVGSFLFLAVVLSAQPGGRSFDPETLAKRQTDRMQQVLDLSPEQTDAVRDINLEYIKRMLQAREMTAGNQEATREVIGALRREQNQALQRVLAPEQIKKWTAFLEARRGNRRGGGGPD